MKLQCCILFAILLTSCVKNKKEGKDYQLETIRGLTTQIEKNESKAVACEDSILIEQRVMHEFSQTDKKDEFYVCIKGKSVTDGKMIIKIISHDGMEILNEEFPSYLLMNYGFKGNLNSIKDREEYMKSRIVAFFDEKEFSYPAIKPDDIFNEDYSNKEIWDDIRSDQTAIGFHYILGEEDGRSIAFSKKTKKVVMYFNCC